MDQIVLESEPEILDSWSWRGNWKFEFQLHSCGWKIRPLQVTTDEDINAKHQTDSNLLP